MRQTERGSFFLKCFSLVLCLLLILVIGLFISTNNILDVAVESTLNDSIAEDLAGALEYTNLYLDYAKNAITTISQDRILQNNDEEKISRTLENYANANGIFDNLYLQYEDGRVICGKQYVFDAMKYELPKIDFKSDIITFTVTAPYFSRMVQQDTVAAAVQMNFPDGSRPVLIGEFKSANFVESVKKIVGANVSFALYSTDGDLIMYHTDSMKTFHGPGSLGVRPSHSLFEEARTYAMNGSVSPHTYENILMLVGTVSEVNWRMVLMVESNRYPLSIATPLNDIKMLIILCFPVVFIISLLIGRRSSWPVIQLSKSLDQIENTNNISLPARLTKSRDEIGKLSRSIEDMLKRIDIYVKKERKTQEERSRLEMKLLQSQISPHFISNSLSCAVTYLLRDNSKVALSTIRQLIRILNYGVDKIDDTVTLREELEFLKVYCDIFRMRKHSSFELMVEVSEEAMNMPLPKLLLQPPVENALFHGFPEAQSGQRLCITSEHRKDQLVILIWDNGKTVDAKEIDRLNALLKTDGISQDKHGVGLKNCAARIRLLYGPEYGIHLHSQPGNGFTTCITLPWNAHQTYKKK